jgi:hypothetical protein
MEQSARNAAYAISVYGAGKNFLNRKYTSTSALKEDTVALLCSTRREIMPNEHDELAKSIINMWFFGVYSVIQNLDPEVLGFDILEDIKGILQTFGWRQTLNR